MTTTEHQDTAPDWARVEAGHRAVDALNNIIGELRGLLEHDPDARAELHDALRVVLGDDLPALGTPVVVLDTYSRKLTVTAEHRTIEGHSFGMVSINEDWDSDEDEKRELDSWLPLDPDQADALADAIHAAAAATRQQQPHQTTDHDDTEDQQR